MPAAESPCSGIFNIEAFMPEAPAPPSISSDESSGRVWTILRTGVLIAGSALFGGLAVALWNRRALARLRQLPESAEETAVRADGEEE